MFQSLLSWKYNQIMTTTPSNIYMPYCFNPCYLGNTIRSSLSFSVETMLKLVSILVILEIQSDLTFPQAPFHKVSSFNPCYLGNTIRSGMIDQKIEKLLFGFNPCYLGNTIRSLVPIIRGFNITMFQSLLSWKYNQIPKICPNA